MRKIIVNLIHKLPFSEAVFSFEDEASAPNIIWLGFSSWEELRAVTTTRLCSTMKKIKPFINGAWFGTIFFSITGARWGAPCFLGLR